MTDREPVTHQLKVWPRFWGALESGKKTFELRLNDRDFRVGDILHLEEWDPSCGHTGRTIEREVTCYLDGFPWLTEGYCCLGIKPVGQARGAQQEPVALRKPTAAEYRKQIENEAIDDAIEHFKRQTSDGRKWSLDYIVDELAALKG
jgi:hypothetical protein